MKKITMQMVADKLGVSKALVSKALSQDPAVSEQTRETVFRTAREMGYRMKRVRGERKGGTSGSVAVLMPQGLMNEMEYWGKVIRGLDLELARSGYNLMLSGIDSDKPAREGLPPMVSELRADGVIGMGHMPVQYTDALKSTGLPLIMVDANVLEPEVGHVFANNVLGAYETASMLLSKGHRSLIYAGDEESAWSFAERLRGAQSAVRRWNQTNSAEAQAVFESLNGIGVSGHGLYVLPEFPASLQEQVRTAAATAIICGNDLIAIEVLKMLNNWGVRCPEQISVTGFDDLSAAAIVHPPLTTVSVPKEAIGSRAARMLIELMERRTDVPEHVFLAVRMVERSSTASPPTEKIKLN